MLPNPSPVLKHYESTLLLSGLAFLAGIALGQTHCWEAAIGLFIVSSVFLGMALVNKNYKQNLKLAFSLVCLTLGLLWTLFCGYHPTHSQLLNIKPGDSYALQGRYQQEGPVKHSAIIELQRLNNKPIKERVLLQWRQETPPKAWQPGETLSWTGWIDLPKPAFTAGDFDFKAYLAQYHIAAVAHLQHLDQSQLTSQTGFEALLAWALQLRAHITTQLIQALGEQGKVLASVFLGEHAVGLDEGIKSDFIRSGLVHTLAASGLNVGLVGALFLFLGRKLPPSAQLALAGLMIAFYAAMTGFPPSVQRAAMMFEIALLIKLCNKQLAPVSLLVLSGVCLAIVNPSIVSMVGFQLSFMSTLGLLLMVPPLEKRLGYYLSEWLATLILLPIIAQLWVTPLLMFYFNDVQLLAVPANIIAVPFVSILTLIGFFLSALSLVMPLKILAWLLKPVLLLSQGFVSLAHGVSQLPFSTITCASPPLVVVIALYSILLALGWKLYAGLSWKDTQGWKKLILFSGLTILLPCLILRYSAPDFRMAWLQNNQTAYGTHGAMVIQQPASQLSWVFFPSLQTSSVKTVIRYLKHQGDHTIEACILGDVANVKAETLDALFSGLKIQRFYLLPQSQPSVVFRKRVADKGVPTSFLASTTLWQHPDASGVAYAQSDAFAFRLQANNRCIASVWGDAQFAAVVPHQPCLQIQQEPLQGMQTWRRYPEKSHTVLAQHSWELAY
jgi:ComEC/Rec2-related protein